MRSCIEWYYFHVRWPMVLYMPLVSFDQTNFNGVWPISKLFGAVSPISLRAKPETRTDAIFLTFGVPSSLDHEQHRVLPLLTKTLDWKMDALKKKSIWTKQEWVCWWSVQWLSWAKWKKYRAYDSIATFLKSKNYARFFRPQIMYAQSIRAYRLLPSTITRFEADLCSGKSHRTGTWGQVVYLSIFCNISNSIFS